MLNSKPKILVFIPAYNCEKQIVRVIKQFTPEMQELFDEVLVVENRSPDGTLATAKQALENLQRCRATLLQNKNNYSLGGSHKVAFNYAIEHGFDYVVVLHGDDQGNINDLVPHIKSGKISEYDSYLGSRFAKGSKLPGYSTFRIFGNIVFNLAVSLVMRRKVTDLGSGLNIYKTTFLSNRFYLPFPNNLTFNVFMLFYSVWSKSSFSFFPLTWREDDQVSNAKVFRQAWIILKIMFQYLTNSASLFASDSPYSRIEYLSDTIFQQDAKD